MLNQEIKHILKVMDFCLLEKSIGKNLSNKHEKKFLGGT